MLIVWYRNQLKGKREELRHKLKCAAETLLIVFWLFFLNQLLNLRFYSTTFKTLKAVKNSVDVNFRNYSKKKKV